MTILLCPVEVADPASLAATPTSFPPGLRERFLSDEIDPGSLERTLPQLRGRIEETGKVIARHQSPFSIARHLCEVADQWAFFEVPGLVGASREAMALEVQNQGEPLLRAGLARPLRQLRMELSRPYFWFQPGAVETTAYQHEGALTCVHRLTIPGGELHGVAIEQF